MKHTLINPTARELKKRKLEEWSDALMRIFSLMLFVIMIFTYCMIVDPYKPDLLIIMAVIALLILVAAIILGKVAKRWGRKKTLKTK